MNLKYAPIGGMLTGDQIIKNVKAGLIEIDPFDISRVNPNSYNLTLNSKLLVYNETTILDFKKPSTPDTLIIPEEGIIIYPGKLYLGRTNERTFTDKYIPNIDGRSSTGRLGVSAHITAGFGDIGFNGTWTLEIVATVPTKIYPNIEFCQICYFSPCGDADTKYDGRYQNQIEPTASRSYIV